METLRATLRNFLKAPEDGKASGFAVVLYETANGLSPAKVGGPFTSGMKPGDWFIAQGDWRQNMFRGQVEDTFSARSIRPDLPVTPQGVSELLSRTFTVERHGIDGKSISKYVREHGGELARMIEKEPSLLLKMSSDAARFGSMILQDWGRRNSGRMAVNLLDAAGIGPRIIDAVIEAHRDDAVAIIKANPYSLVSLPEVKFEDADKIGRHLGIAKDDPRRVIAAVSDAVKDNGNEGHTFTPLSGIADALKKRDIDPARLSSIVRGTAGEGGLEFDIVAGDAVAQPEHLSIAEKGIARMIGHLLSSPLHPEHAQSIASCTELVLKKDKYARFDEFQKAAVARSAAHRVSILTGGPGTGKSTVTEAIADIAAATSQGPVILLAPTGKAARRLAEATGRPAQTVHRGLEARMEGGRHSFLRNHSNPLPEGCFVVVDEASMLDAETAAALLNALPQDGRILFVGDRFQLPSVGPGYVLGDLIAARGSYGQRVPYSELVNVYRTDRNSSIAKGAAMIKNGEVPALDNKVRGGLVLFEHKTPMIVDRVVGLVAGPIQRQLNLNPCTDVAILCPQAPGPAGTWEINTRLSSELNPNGAKIEGISHGPYDNPKMPLPRVGDRVMLTKNDPDNDVMNGDVGTLVEVFVAKGGSGKDRRRLKVAFDTGQIVNFPISRWRDLIPSYAMTGHKSQGSQYPLVIMPLTTAHARMLERTLIYTEWTRAQDYLMLVGEREALEIAAETVTATQRRTRLRDFLEERLNEMAPPVQASRTPVPRPGTRSLLRKPRPAADPEPSLPTP